VTVPLSSRDPEVHDLPALLILVGGDRPLMHEIIALFLQEAPRLMGNVRDAATRGDLGALQFSAHALKGSVGNMAAARTSHAAAELETHARAGQLPEARAALATLERALAELLTVLTNLPAPRLG
jgi:HPt (histidine-containing phosphotransfer) domain-containing protein